MSRRIPDLRQGPGRGAGERDEADRQGLQYRLHGEPPLLNVQAFILHPRARYTTLLRAVELWGAVQADGPGRLAGDEEPPAVDGFVVGCEENFSQQIKANPEDRLSTAFVGLDDDGPVFRLPFTGRVGERKSHG